MKAATAAAAILPWIAASRDGAERELRQAVHTVLVAISKAAGLPENLVMKGGILLAIHYDGDRYTRDIDFSTTLSQTLLQPASVDAALKGALTLAVETLDYGLDCRIQSWKMKPPDPRSSWPTLTFTIGYAPKADAHRHRRLLASKSTEILSLDLSYNEVITAVEVLNIVDGATVQASTLADLVAEKYRAIIQQPVRNRIRRQDAYDLYRLLDNPELHDPEVQTDVLAALKAKSAARDLAVARESLQNPEVRTRSEAQYPQLRDEIRVALPDFSALYAAVSAYYESLPW